MFSLLSCCFDKESKRDFLSTCGGYIFKHSTPLIIEMEVSKVFLDQVKIGDRLILEVSDFISREQAISEIIAINTEDNIIYILPKVKLYINYSHLEIKHLCG
jgi:hypothetical protein